MDYYYEYYYYSSLFAGGNESLNASCPRRINLTQIPFDTTFAYAAGIPASIIILLTICGNMMVLCTKAQVGHRQTMLLVWNLGLADLLVGCVVLPMSICHLIMRRWVFGRLLCRIWICCDIIFVTASIVTICMISVDRYMAVTRPLKYKVAVTKNKVVTAIIIVWLSAIAIPLSTVQWTPPPCYNEHVCFVGNEIRFLTHSVVVAFFLPALVTLTLYWKIYKLAKTRERAIESGFIMIFGKNMNFLTSTLSTSQPLRVHCGGRHKRGSHPIHSFHRRCTSRRRRTTAAPRAANTSAHRENIGARLVCIPILLAAVLLVVHDQ